MQTQQKQSLKRQHPDSQNNMAPLEITSVPRQEETSAPNVQKRTLDEDESVQVPPKKRRVLLPTIVSVPNISTVLQPQSVIKRSSSCNSLSGQTGVSPVELLRSLKLECANKKLGINGVTFIKPTDVELSSYDSTVVNAVRNANIEKLRSVHKEGKSLNACNRFGESLLHMACRRGNADVVRYMVEEAKVNVAVRDDYGRTVLHDATWTASPNLDVMEILLKAVNPEMLLAEDVRGHTPFDYARKEHWSQWVEFLSDNQDKLEPQEVSMLQIG